MRYIVTGADRKTGSDSQMIVSAATAQDAERFASEKGVLVASVRPAPGAMATDVSNSALPIWDEDPSTPPSAQPSTRAGASESPAPAADAPPPAPAGHDQVTASSGVPASARYHVIQNPALYLLEAAVNKHMKEGWQPLGGIQVSYATNQLVYYQTMVRPQALGDRA